MFAQTAQQTRLISACLRLRHIDIDTIIAVSAWRWGVGGEPPRTSRVMVIQRVVVGRFHVPAYVRNDGTRWIRCSFTKTLHAVGSRDRDVLLTFHGRTFA